MSFLGEKISKICDEITVKYQRIFLLLVKGGRVRGYSFGLSTTLISDTNILIHISKSNREEGEGIFVWPEYDTNQ